MKANYAAEHRALILTLSSQQSRRVYFVAMEIGFVFVVLALNGGI